MTARELARMAMYVALFLVLDWVSGNLLPAMPQGGSLGLSTIVLIIAAFDLGLIKSLFVVILCLMLSFFTDPPYFVNFFQYFLDYVVGYAAYSLAVVLRNPRVDDRNIASYVLPILVPNVIRFFSSSLAGVLYYGVNWWGSFVYQSGYVIPTIVVTFLILPFLYPRLKPMLKA